jgi:Tol biopolymer transport system component
MAITNKPIKIFIPKAKKSTVVLCYFCENYSNINCFLMKYKRTVFIIFSGLLLSISSLAQLSDTLHYPDENHFKNIQQLTFGGDNAEAYWSYDGKYIVFQRTSIANGIPCDQIFMGKVPTAGQPFEFRMISSGKGRTTCAFFTKDNKHIVYASTHLGGVECPPVPDRSKYRNRYIWPVYSSFDIFITDTGGKKIKRLTDTPGYDAEATISPDGKKMVFTSIRNGDLDLYIMDLKTGKVKQITSDLGYDGGAWFSPDSKKIVWRASRPKTAEEIKEYKELLSEGMVAPTKMEVWTANADGSGAKQITQLGQANWAPNFMPDGRIIFCSNHEYKRGFPFNMYTMNADGTGLEKVSRDKGFDAFPMFSPDGKKILFSSNRNNGGTRDTNLFIADWVK